MGSGGRVRAAEKAPDGGDRQTDTVSVHYMMIVGISCMLNRHSPGGVLASGQRAVDSVAADGRSGRSSVGELGPVYLPPSVGVNSTLAGIDYHPDVNCVILPPVQHDGTLLPGQRYSTRKNLESANLSQAASFNFIGNRTSCQNCFCQTATFCENILFHGLTRSLYLIN